jgi:hypothetical protein
MTFSETALISIHIPASVLVTDDACLFGCKSLASVTFDAPSKSSCLESGVHGALFSVFRNQLMSFVAAVLHLSQFPSIEHEAFHETPITAVELPAIFKLSLVNHFVISSFFFL